MSDKMTELVALGRGVLMDRGHVSRAEIEASARNWYRRQATEAAEVLAALDAGEFIVYHQRGVYRVRNRVEAS